MRSFALVSLVFLVVCSLFSATISSTFRRFIREKYGAEVERRIARDDFPNGRGSFGGGAHKAGRKTKKRPVILVHGSSTTAWHGLGIAAQFKTHGYKSAELYATTYGMPTSGRLSNTQGYRCD
ncbi:Lipase domain containing protein [Aphelenchoides fujianensis]|nr:Lipase domain containing protein [Aphelenchoides fujianensis]